MSPDAEPFPTADARPGGDASGDGGVEKLCNGLDDDGDGDIDEGPQCVHAVECAVFDDGYANATAIGDAIYSPAAEQLCSGPDCRRWFGTCRALASADGHEHAVTFRVFDDGYANMAGPQDAIYVRGPGEVCVPGGAVGECRPWFGRATTDVVNGHEHKVECELFDDGYANPTGLSDAIASTGPDSLCLPNGECRRYFGRCRTVETTPAP